MRWQPGPSLNWVRFHLKDRVGLTRPDPSLSFSFFLQPPLSFLSLPHGFFLPLSWKLPNLFLHDRTKASMAGPSSFSPEPCTAGAATNLGSGFLFLGFSPLSLSLSTSLPSPSHGFERWVWGWCGFWIHGVVGWFFGWRLWFFGWTRVGCDWVMVVLRGCFVTDLWRWLGFNWLRIL